MTAGADSLDHLRRLCQLLEELGPNGVLLESHEYDSCAFGGFIVVLARGKAKAKFIWDGKDSVLTVEFMKAGTAGAAGSWEHDAYIEVPERLAVFSEIASNTVAMLG